MEVPELKITVLSEEFRSVRLYGSQEQPLFSFSDVTTVLGLAGAKITKYSLNEGEDYIYAKPATHNARRQIMLTESGLYLFTLRSDSPVGRKFSAFVVSVLRELRLRGVVTLQKALEDFQGRTLAAEAAAESHRETAVIAEERARAAENRIARLADHRYSFNLSDGHKLEILQKRYMRLLHIYGGPEGWTFRFKELKTAPVESVYVFRRTKIVDIHKALRAFESEKKITGSIEDIINVLEEYIWLNTMEPALLLPTL